jgi:20S proteasome alpha/beta subunit
MARRQPAGAAAAQQHRAQGSRHGQAEQVLDRRLRKVAEQDEAYRVADRVGAGQALYRYLTVSM